MSFFSNLAHQDSANGERGPSRSISLVRATDIDEFLKPLRGYNFGLLQLDRGPFVGEFIQTQLGGVFLTAAHFERAVVQSGTPPAGTITFAVRMSPSPALWQGRAFGLHELIMGEPGAEIDMVSQPDFSAATASFPPELVEETGERLGLMLPSRTSTSALVGIKHDESKALRAAFNKLLCDAARRPFDERSTRWAVNKQEDLLRVLLQSTFSHLSALEPVHNGERARVLKAALTGIRDRSEEVLTIGDLCRIAKASERTLHYAFTERFGMPPAHYMKAHRLNGARNDLCREPPLKVSDAANKWGFWHLGQFAKDYGSLFGELPSGTLRRRHGPSVVERHLDHRLFGVPRLAEI
jgi:AraC family transcriptional regulator, ethanolamine operon transcriptional activator